jgi:hypothetical protein
MKIKTLQILLALTLLAAALCTAQAQTKKFTTADLRIK